MPIARSLRSCWWPIRGQYLGRVTTNDQSEAGIFHLSVFLHKLECLDESQRLVHAAAHGEVIDGHLPHHALGVNNEQACTVCLHWKFKVFGFNFDSSVVTTHLWGRCRPPLWAPRSPWRCSCWSLTRGGSPGPRGRPAYGAGLPRPGASSDCRSRFLTTRWVKHLTSKNCKSISEAAECKRKFHMHVTM